MELTLNKWGNSQGVRLSNKLLQQLGWSNASTFKVEITSDNKLVLSVVEGEDDGGLAFLFKDYEDDGIREPLIDFGESIGNEAW
jgi:antitoxin MazE